ncbi:contactin-associated protein-like 2 [Argopecten irradians]|uniref:contactin-associated protein-like 2 n=1 Tax=Argopecten irradians TaxID=31199 RepID=UPI003719B9EB
MLCVACVTCKADGSTGVSLNILAMLTVFQLFTFLCTANICSAVCTPCDYDLVTGPYGVSDDAITASSHHDHCPVLYARFSSPYGWCPATIRDGDYLQVEFKTTSTLKAIQTTGRMVHGHLVSSYSVNTSMDGINWISISSNGTVKLFPGNSDDSSIVTNTLGRSVTAKFVRVISVSGTGYRSMRLEVKGCPISNSSTCNQWAATLGSAGDVFPVLQETNAPYQGLCGLMCYRQPDCDSFVFDIGSNYCMLLKSTPDVSYTTVDLENVWYFIKT